MNVSINFACTGIVFPTKSVHTYTTGPDDRTRRRRNGGLVVNFRKRRVYTNERGERPGEIRNRERFRNSDWRARESDERETRRGGKYERENSLTFVSRSPLDSSCPAIRAPVPNVAESVCIHIYI